MEIKKLSALELVESLQKYPPDTYPAEHAQLQAEIAFRQQRLNQQSLPYLASRASRFGASLVDACLSLAIMLVLMFYLGLWSAISAGTVSIVLILKLIAYSLVVFVLLHGYLLWKRGQTIGKKMVGISIVTTEGKIPDLWPLILRRYLPFALLPLIPVLGPFIPCVDVLLIFRKDRRCFHDLLAGTRVINVGAVPDEGVK